VSDGWATHYNEPEECRQKKGCAFPVASQSRSLPQITSTESVAPPSIYRAETPAFLWLSQVYRHWLGSAVTAVAALCDPPHIQALPIRLQTSADVVIERQDQRARCTGSAPICSLAQHGVAWEQAGDGGPFAAGPVASSLLGVIAVRSKRMTSHVGAVDLPGGENVGVV